MIHQPPEHQIALPVHRKTLDLLDAELRAYFAAATLADATQKRLRLILEELVTNSLHYGQCAGSTIDIVLRGAENALRIDYGDHGIAFDPTRETPDDGVDAPLDERRIGGLGWTLIRSLCRDIAYRRERDMNRLTMVLPD